MWREPGTTDWTRKSVCSGPGAKKTADHQRQAASSGRLPDTRPESNLCLHRQRQPHGRAACVRFQGQPPERIRGPRVNSAHRLAARLLPHALLLLMAGGAVFLIRIVADWEGGAAGPVRLTDLAVAVLVGGLGAALAVVRRRQRAAERATSLDREALEMAADGCLAVDSQQRIVFVNRRTAGLFGYEPDELLGRPVAAVLPEPVAPGSGAADAGRELLGQRKDGRELVLLTQAGPSLPIGGRLASTLLLRDITRTKQTREILRTREAHLKQVVEQMPAVLWATNTELRITSTLGAGLAALNVRAEEVIGMSMRECLEQDDPATAPIAAHLKAVRGESLSYEMAWKGRTFQVRVDPLRGPDGRIAGTVGILLDVTDHKQALVALRARERQQAAVADLGLRALTRAVLPVIMNDAALAIARALGADFCEILETPPGHRAFRPLASTGWAGEHIGNAPAIAGAGGQAEYTLRAVGP